MYRKILVPLDGSTFGEHALPVALAIARRASAEVEIVRVHVPTTPLYLGGEFASDLTVEAAIQKQERDYLDEVARRAAVAGVSIKPAPLMDGPVGEALAGHARATGADLLVMTTHGRGPLSRLWLGSIADRLVRLTEAPLLLVRPRETSPDFAANVLPSRILVALDGSPLAEKIGEPAQALGHLAAAEFLLVRVIQPALPANYSVPGDGITSLGQSLLKQLEEQETASRHAAEEYLESMARRLRAEGLTVRTRVVRHELPSEAILEQARAESVDLIALETHGRHGLPRLFLGSVADKVLRGAPVPVLVQCRRTANGEEETATGPKAR